jgi:hypothetical protein
MNGLPTKESGHEIGFIKRDQGIRIVQFIPRSSGLDPLICTICEVNYDPERNNLDYLGGQIVNLIREARDIGFEQGREYIVNALGPRLNKLI